MSDSHEKYLELMHAEMDGEASDEELANLREYLASNPEAQRVHAELAKLTGVLNKIEQVETPDYLHKNILAALPSRRRAPGTMPHMSPWHLRIPMIHYGYALAAGLLLGAIITGFALRNISTVEKSDVYGTMTAREDTQHDVAVEQVKLEAPDLEGSVRLSRPGSDTTVVFELNGGQPVEIEVGFDGSQAGLKGFSQKPSGIRRFEVRDGRISFRSEGRQISTVLFTNLKNARLILDLKFYVAGKLVHQGTLGSSEGTPK